MYVSIDFKLSYTLTKVWDILISIKRFTHFWLNGTK